MIEDYQDKQLDEGLTMPLSMENSDCTKKEAAVLEQPKPKVKLVLSSEDNEAKSRRSRSNDERLRPQPAQEPGTYGYDNQLSVPFNLSICADVTPTKEMEAAQKKFPLVSMRNQKMQ